MGYEYRAEIEPSDPEAVWPTVLEAVRQMKDIQVLEELDMSLRLNYRGAEHPLDTQRRGEDIYLEYDRTRGLYVLFNVATRPQRGRFLESLAEQLQRERLSGSFEEL